MKRLLFQYVKILHILPFLALPISGCACLGGTNTNTCQLD